MNVRHLIFINNNRFIHDAVYKPAETKEFFQVLDDPLNWLYPHIAMGHHNSYMSRCAARIVYIGLRSRALMAALANFLLDRPFYSEGLIEQYSAVNARADFREQLTSQQLSNCAYLLHNMIYCTPNQGFVNSSPGDAKSCDQYRLCPWCRYRKARQLFNALAALLGPGRNICVTHFMVSCRSNKFDLNSPRVAYEKVARSIRDQRDWFGDYLITLPQRIRASDKTWHLVWRTSLIAVTEEDKLLPLPESLAPKHIKGANFLSDGIVYCFPAEPEGLRDAFSLVMGYPKWMLTTDLANDLCRDILTVLLAGDRNRAVPHGLRGLASTDSYEEQAAAGQAPAAGEDPDSPAPSSLGGPSNTAE